MFRANNRKPEAQSPEATTFASAYIAAVRLLSRRELSEAQIRQRLARRGYDEQSIDDAVVRLKSERAIDDERTASAIARTETGIKHRGPRRIRQQIQQAGISSAIADRAVKEAFDGLDADAVLEAALRKRLRTGAMIRDDREFARLYRFLTGQGFNADQVVRILDTRRK
jgi:regulatory protein